MLSLIVLVQHSLGMWDPNGRVEGDSVNRENRIILKGRATSVILPCHDLRRGH